VFEVGSHGKRHGRRPEATRIPVQGNSCGISAAGFRETAKEVKLWAVGDELRGDEKSHMSISRSSMQPAWKSAPTSAQRIARILMSGKTTTNEPST